MHTVERLLYSVSEAGHAIGVSRNRAYELVRTGQLPSIRIGKTLRVPVSALQDWIAQQLHEQINRGAA